MKRLLLGASLALGIAIAASAQTTIMFQNFAASMTAMPAGWDTGYAAYHPGNPGFKFNDAFAGSDWHADEPTHGYVAFVDDIDYNTTPDKDYDTLYTASFNCSAYAHVFISLDLNFNNYTGGEVGTIAVSTNGGVTWTTAVNLPSIEGNTDWQDSLLFDLSSYAAGQANVKLAFTWNNANAYYDNVLYAGWGMGVANIDVYSPANYNVQVASQNLPYLMQVGKAYNFSGEADNWGGDAITSMDMNYSVNGGGAVTQNISGISGWDGLYEYSWSMNSSNAAFTPATVGTYTVKFWSNNLNGTNPNINTDTLKQTFLVVDSIQPKRVLFEEFMQASCDPCMEASPNLDGVLGQVGSLTAIIRFHEDWPDLDWMNDETETPFVSARTSYYGVDAIPDAKVDGSTDVDPASVTVANVQTAQAIGSPFKIDITSFTFDAGTDTYSASATIKSYATFASGLTMQAVLAIDTIKYDTNQSVEDPDADFDPPDGTYSGNGIPDSYYQYVTIFPNVAEDMMPSSSGTTLAAFTPLSTQTVSVSWAANHPWGYEPKKYKYDSANPGTYITFFVQTNSGYAAAGVPAKYVYQSALKSNPEDGMGIPEVAQGVYFEMYPNPTNASTNLAFKLDKEQTVSVQVYNMLGQQVYHNDEGMMSTGQHILTIDGSTLKSGMYFVKFITDNAVTTQKLVIQK